MKTVKIFNTVARVNLQKKMCMLSENIEIAEVASNEHKFYL